MEFFSLLLKLFCCMQVYVFEKICSFWICVSFLYAMETCCRGDRSHENIRVVSGRATAAQTAVAAAITTASSSKQRRVANKVAAVTQR